MRLLYLTVLLFNLILWNGQIAKAKEYPSSFHSNLGELVALSISDPPINSIEPITYKVNNKSSGNLSLKNKKTKVNPLPELASTSPDPNGSNSLSDEELNRLLFGDLNLNETEKEESNVELLKPKEWLPSISVSLGFGFSDNPMYGPYIRESSGYTEIETESFLMRQSDPDYLSYLYFYGEGKRFFDLPDYKLSGILLLQGEHTYKPKKSNRSFGLKLRHTYYDQAFDFSDLGLPFSMQVQSNKSEIIPHFEYRINSTTKLSIEGSQGLEKYDTPSENNEDQQIQASIKWMQNKNYTWKGRFFNRWVQYDERVKKNADGSSINNEILDTSKWGALLSLERESQSRWIRSVVFEIRYEDLHDNAGGYYDYVKTGAKLSHQMNWTDWHIETTLGWTDYQYDLRQTATEGTFERQSKSMDLLITRKLNSNWESYFKWRYEEDLSNSRDYEYYSNFWSLGVNWEH